MTNLPAGVSPGQIYRDTRYYQTPAGEWKPKYLLVLCGLPGQDVVYRLLTSPPHGRPESPPCYQGNPYGGFFMGRLGGPLTKNSWVDLRSDSDTDLDGRDFLDGIRSGGLQYSQSVDTNLLCQVLGCVASADDTSFRHERAIRDQMALLSCP